MRERDARYSASIAIITVGDHKYDYGDHNNYFCTCLVAIIAIITVGDHKYDYGDHNNYFCTCLVAIIAIITVGDHKYDYGDHNNYFCTCLVAIIVVSLNLFQSPNLCEYLNVLSCLFYNEIDKN